MVSPLEGHVYHNRLTHTLEVAQLARRIAQKLLQPRGSRRVADSLDGLDPDVAEAAALAHDLGHPPFGHAGEHTLDSLLRQNGVADGFEGAPNMLGRRGTVSGWKAEGLPWRRR